VACNAATETGSGGGVGVDDGASEGVDVSEGEGAEDGATEDEGSAGAGDGDSEVEHAASRADERATVTSWRAHLTGPTYVEG
jgi:hypothetical protein